MLSTVHFSYFCKKSQNATKTAKILKTTMKIGVLTALISTSIFFFSNAFSDFFAKRKSRKKIRGRKAALSNKNNRELF